MLDPSTMPDRPGYLRTRRGFLAGMAIGLALPVAASCRVAPVPDGAARVPDYRRPGDRDDTAAASRALAAGTTAYFPAGGGSGPQGAYLLDAVKLRSGVTLCGDGDGSVLRTASPEAQSALMAMSDAPDQVLNDITLRDLRIEGLVARTGFREHWNLIHLSGVSGVRIDRVAFIGFAGDGLYLGAERAWPTRETRIIRDIVVSDCVFDGLTNDNRNGISVTGGSDITIDRCRFRRCTRPDMPGPIDFEPDAFPDYTLARLRVTDCDFEDCGGNVGQIALVVPSVVPVPRDVLIAGNSFRGYRGTGGDIAVTINREPDAATRSMACVIERNTGVGGNGGVHIVSGKGITVRANRWTGYRSRSFLGSLEPMAGVMDVSVSDRFEGCGWKEGVAFAIYKGTGVRMENNQFVRTGAGSAQSAPIYLGTGRIRRLALVNNDFSDNPASAGVIIVERGGDYLPRTGEVARNILPAGKVFPEL